MFGSSSPTSFLWQFAGEGHAIPFTQVFVRPRLTSFSWTTIPDSGTPAVTLPAGLSVLTDPLPAGVVGVNKTGDSEPSLDTPVLAFAQWGSRIFVGGKLLTTSNPDQDDDAALLADLKMKPMTMKG